MMRLLIPILFLASTANADEFSEFQRSIIAFSCEMGDKKEEILIGKVAENFTLLTNNFGVEDVEETSFGYKFFSARGEPVFLNDHGSGWEIYSAHQSGFFHTACTDISAMARAVAGPIFSVTGQLSDANKARLEDEIRALSGKLLELNEVIATERSQSDASRLQLEAKLESVEAERQAELAAHEAEYQSELSRLEVEHESKLAALEAEHSAELARMESSIKRMDEEADNLRKKYKGRLERVYGVEPKKIFEDELEVALALTPCWRDNTSKSWNPGSWVEVRFQLDSTGKPDQATVVTGSYKANTANKDDIFSAAKKVILDCGPNISLDLKVWKSVDVKFIAEDTQVEVAFPTINEK